MHSKKIIHIANRVRNCGNGIANAMVDLACEQAKAGHEVYIISGGGEFEPFLAEHNVTHIKIDQTRSPLIIIKALREIRRHLKRIRPDVVHAHVMTGLLLMKFLGFFDNYILIATLHNEFQKSAILMKYADRIIAVSAQVKEAMIKRGVPPHKIYTVRNGVTGSAREKMTVSDSAAPVGLRRRSVTTVAGLYKRKGIDILIKAFEIAARDFSDIHLYIVGDGPERDEFVALAQASPVADRIHFEGFQKNTRDYLAETDIFVLASRHESFGLAGAEARAAGCAVIGSDIGGIPEVLNGGAAGTLFPPQDYKALAAAIKKHLESEEFLKSQQKKALENIEWLSIRRAYEETLRVYFAKEKTS